MSDLFHERVPDDYIEAVGRVMQQASRHLFQVLTKRHERMHDLLTGSLAWTSALVRFDPPLLTRFDPPLTRAEPPLT
jgi:protein gp37